MPIRLATAVDIPALIALDHDAPTAAHWSHAQYEIAVDGVDRVTILLEEDSAIRGFLVIRRIGSEWEVENIVIACPHRRRGFASQLLAKAIRLARAQSAAVIFLEVRESNLGAQKLYEKCGFRSAGNRPGYYHDPEENALIYRLTLL